MQKLGEDLQDIQHEYKEHFVKLEKSLVKISTLEEAKPEISKLFDLFLGPDGKLNKLLRGLKKIDDPQQKKKIGQQANALREKIQSELNKLSEKFAQQLIDRKIESDKIDVSRGGVINPDFADKIQLARGIWGNMPHQHIISKTIEEIEDIFTSMGFEVEYANEVDSAFNAFDALNIPQNHPARDNWDTLWLEDGNLAIPHTSAMQNRILKQGKLPTRKVIIGKCFRNEATDARHEHTFMQVEGVYLDTYTSMSEMLGIMLEFFEAYFERKLKYKFTPDFFPFVEPGGQLAFEFKLKQGDATKVTKTGYLEVLGCGMIHPEVIKMAGQDPTKVMGFAWGFGIERIALLKYGIDDIRTFYSSDLRFIEQFV